jgi:hypothetical protein
MVVNFRARGISRGARKLARTPTIIKKKKKKVVQDSKKIVLCVPAVQVRKRRDAKF